MKPFITYEHLSFDDAVDNFSDAQEIFFCNDKEKKCIEYKSSQGKTTLYTNYYIGVDWLKKNESAIYVAPKWIFYHKNKYSFLSIYILLLFFAHFF